MTVTKYEKRFTKLAKYALAFIVDETNKCKCIEHELNVEIRTLMTASTNWSGFAKLVENGM